jgi:Protein of unknown function (DUF559)
MAPSPRIPLGLRLGPFTVADARAAGISAKALRGNEWTRLERGIYCWSQVLVDPLRLLTALHRLYGRESVFAGRTAAWLLGICVDPAEPIEIIVAPSSGMRTRRGLTVRRANLGATEVATVRGLPTTSALRTLCDLCPRMEGVEALALIDAALRLRLVDKTRLSQASSPCLRSLGLLAEPAESRMETRLRWLLLKAGLPRPEVQKGLHDSQGRFVGRADLYYPEARLVIEYDGANHRDRLVEDDRRQNLLLNAGYTMLRFTASDIYNRPDTVVAQVSAAAGASAIRPAAARH